MIFTNAHAIVNTCIFLKRVAWWHYFVLATTGPYIADYTKSILHATYVIRGKNVQHGKNKKSESLDYQ